MYAIITSGVAVRVEVGALSPNALPICPHHRNCQEWKEEKEATGQVQRRIERLYINLQNLQFRRDLQSNL